MKKIFLIIAALTIYSQLLGQQQYRAATIGFYNLENLFDTINDPKINDDEFTPTGAKGYTPAVFNDKIEKLADVISQVATDKVPDGVMILGISEIENRSVIEALVAHPKIQSRNYQIIHFDSPDLRGVDVGLIYNPKYFRPFHKESLEVKLNGDEGKGYFTRDVLYTAGNFLGDTVHIFVNHWPSRRGGEEASNPARFAAAGVVKGKTDSILAINPDAKIVIMGDLNDDPISPSIAVVLGAKGDKAQVERGGLFNPWVDMYKKGIGSNAYQDSWSLFDQIMVSSGFLDEQSKGFYFKSATIFKKEFMLQKTGKYKGYPKRTYDGNRYIGGYSDHFPTFLLFVKPVN